MMNRPYEFVPLIGLLILIENYSKLVKEDFKLQKDLDQMREEINIRFNLEDDKQISIEEYIRIKSKGEE